MPAPVVVSGLMATVTITDGEGNTLGTAESPLQVESADLKAAIGDVVEEIRDFKETVKLITS